MQRYTSNESRFSRPLVHVPCHRALSVRDIDRSADADEFFYFLFTKAADARARARIRVVIFVLPGGIEVRALMRLSYIWWGHRWCMQCAVADVCYCCARQVALIICGNSRRWFSSGSGIWLKKAVWKDLIFSCDGKSLDVYDFSARCKCKYYDNSECFIRILSWFVRSSGWKAFGWWISYKIDGDRKAMRLNF